MAAFMAYPELRHPFEKREIHPEGTTTVLYSGNSTQVTGSPSPSGGCLIDPSQLPAINGFTLKPEGACMDDICIPVTQANGLVKSVDGRDWFDLVAFADLMEQPYVADEDMQVWSFGEIPVKREAMMTEAKAPDVELTDRTGKVIRLSDFKGRKALIVTWSSW